MHQAHPVHEPQKQNLCHVAVHLNIVGYQESALKQIHAMLLSLSLSMSCRGCECVGVQVPFAPSRRSHCGHLKRSAQPLRSHLAIAEFGADGEAHRVLRQDYLRLEPLAASANTSAELL